MPSGHNIFAVAYAEICRGEPKVSSSGDRESGKIPDNNNGFVKKVVDKI